MGLSFFRRVTGSEPGQRCRCKELRVCDTVMVCALLAQQLQENNAGTPAGL